MQQTATREAAGRPDHRVAVAARRRCQMRARLLDATMRVYAGNEHHIPSIEDVVREAKVSRGAFYSHFLSLDEALNTLSLALSDEMTREAFPCYDLLKEPWQRFATGFRGFLKRACVDPAWASLVTRSNGTAANEVLVRNYMTEDLRLGRERGQFAFQDLHVAVDFMLGASSTGIAALGASVADRESYMDESLRMALLALGCSHEHRERGISFSRDYLKGWSNWWAA